MNKTDFLIIGGGVAGVTAAETIRQNNPNVIVTVVNDEPYALYSRVMLSKPNFFLGKIPFDQVWLKGEEWYKKNSITFMGGKTAISLNTKEKIVILNNNEQISYDKLLIATGVRTRPWNVSGSHKKGIYSLRTLEDGKAIMNGIKTAKKAVTIGGGFIGFEMADLLKLAGLDTTMILREEYFWQPTLDEASGMMIEQALTKAGIKIMKNAEVAEVIGNESVEGVILKSGEKIPCEMIITGIGVVPPALDWFSNAGVNIKGGILANEYLETNIPDIYTAGDIAEYKDLILEENIQLGNWVNAREQGRIAGLNMLGQKNPFKFVSFYTTQGVGISIAFIGDARPGSDRVIIKRGSPEINSYARIIIVGKELVGATMINRTSELTTIAKLIENNVDVSEKYKELGDVNFDLKQLIK
jgi:NAD(P)H-nitrite reductase large subunit